MYWGPKGGPLTPLPLVDTNVRNVSNKNFLGWMMADHTYHIFPPGSVAVGDYEWVWYFDHAIFGGPTFGGAGEVKVVPAN